jgi:hypothetical protein
VATASARSNPVPSSGASAGARLTVEPPGGELEAGVADRGAHPFPCLLDGPVGQTDDGEVGQAGITVRAVCLISGG